MFTSVYTAPEHERGVCRLLNWESVDALKVGFVTLVLNRVVGVLLVDLSENHIEVLFVEMPYRNMRVAAKLLQCAKSRFTGVTAKVSDKRIARLFGQNGFLVSRCELEWVCSAR